MGAKPKSVAYVPPHLRNKKGGGGAKKGGNKKNNNNKKNDNDKRRPAGEIPTAQSFLLNVTDESPPVMLSKKIRNLKKKLRQIKNLEELRAGGADLSETQLVKIQSASAVEDAINILKERLSAINADKEHAEVQKVADSSV